MASGRTPDASPAVPSRIDATGSDQRLAAMPDALGRALIGLGAPLDPARRDAGTRPGGVAAAGLGELARPSRRMLRYRQGEIRSSLYQDGTDAGLPVEIVMQLFRMFSYDVDFQRDLQPGDRFDVVYDDSVAGDGHARATPIVRYAALSLSGTALRLYRFQRDQGGESGYFNELGESVQRALLRTPIDGVKLTSGYGMRKHPILGYSRMHRGVDFGGPVGTPILAAGSGVVEQVGRKGGYGNYIRLRHEGGYATAYGHLRGFAKGLKAGARVRQGQVIGYLGQTGMATGPHLHYEVLVGDRQVNPLSVRLPTRTQLAGVELARFRAEKALIDQQLRRGTRDVEVAALWGTPKPSR